MDATATMSAAPPAPAPCSVSPPAPRVLWTSAGPDHLRLLARHWDDGHPATYNVEARHGRHWQPASGEETLRLLWLLAAALDQGGPLEHEPRESAPP